jgi:MFS family permease
MMICGALMGTACLGMALSTSQWMLYVFTGIYGLGYGAVWPVYAASASDFFSKNQTGGIVGLWTIFLGAGSIFSPIAGGVSIDLTGSYTWAFVMGLISGVLSAVLLIGVNRVNGRQP